MASNEQHMIDSMFLGGVISSSEAWRISTPTKSAGFLRALVDHMLVGLCAYAFGEAGRRAYLVQLELLGRAATRESLNWKDELSPVVANVVSNAVEGINEQNRDDRRWAIIDELGAGADDRTMAAKVVVVRVHSTRVHDGLLHPVLCAHLISGIPHDSGEINRNLHALSVIDSSTRLLANWKADFDNRNQIEQEMLTLFRKETWERQSVG